MTIVGEYLDLSKKYTEMYGEKSIVLMQVGSFYEIYAENVDDPKMVIACDLLNLRIAKKKLAVQTVSMAGFPDHAVKRFEKMLLKNGFTIIFVNQKAEGKKFARYVENIVSPGSNIDENEETESCLASVLIEVEENDTFVSFTKFDVNTGMMTFQISIGVHLKHLKEVVHKLCVDNSINELLLNIVTVDVEMYESFEIKLDRFVLIHKKILSPKDAKIIYNARYQKEKLEKYFDSFANLYRDIFETLDLHSAIPSDIANILFMLEFLEIHDKNLITKLAKPRMINNNQREYLKKINHVDKKLDVISENSKNLFEILNKTSTLQGKHKLRFLLKNPITNSQKLNRRYDTIQKFIDTNVLEFLQNHLKKSCNAEKLYRRIQINKFAVDDIKAIFALNTKSKAIIEKLYEIDAIFVPDSNVFSDFKQYDMELNYFFNYDFINDVSKESIFKHRNIFRNNATISELYADIDTIEDEIMTIKNSLSLENEIKLNLNDKFGFFFETSKKRSADLKQFTDYDFTTTTSSVKLTSKRTRALTERYNTLIKKLFYQEREIVTEFFEKMRLNHIDSIMIINQCIVWTDVFCSMTRNAIENKYTRPIIIENSSSFIEAKALKHPIIDYMLKNTKKSYIPNDVTLNESGLIMFGVNSVGKSSLMKSIGIATIMAQAGMFVSADEFKFNPFETISVRIGNQDNLFDAHSSFISEVIEIENIIQNSNEHSLIIADEVCSSTERESALQIISSLTKWVSMKKSCFIISSHIFEIVKKINTQNNIKFCYLDVKFDDDEIVFTRKLKFGVPEIQNYGTKIANHIFNDENFKKILQRETTTQQKEKKMNVKKSRYNNRQLVESCEVCGYAPDSQTSIPLDVHHINFQCNAIDNFNKNGTRLNDTSNLVSLCKLCHIEVHKQKIIINGYVENINGVKLDYTK